MDTIPEAGKFRTILPQVLAVTAKNILLFDLGLSVAFPAIVIPALRGTVDSNEELHFTENQASWFASIAFIFQPIGGVLSGIVTDPIGRKKSLIVVNIPHIIAWILLSNANSLAIMYCGAMLLGFGVGLMEAPVLTYVGEICQPSIRGIMISLSSISVTLGISTVFWLNVIATWRITALLCLIVPLFAAVAICFVPETPMWLLSKNREEDALKSLQWLRGWVSPTAVEKEFTEIKRYSANSSKCASCQKSNITCTHLPAKTMEKINELFRKRTVKAFILVMGLFAIGQFNGLLGMRPFLVQIFKAYKVPINPKVAMGYLGNIGLVANVVCMSTIRLLGKRTICLIGLIGAIISCTCLGVFGLMNFPENYTSFNENEDVDFQSSYFPLVAFYFFCFWTTVGVTSIPWFLLSEVFGFKSRGMATGMCAALNYTMGFVTTKFYLNLDRGLGLNGVMWFYTSVNVIGIIFVYFTMPETENRTLEDIEAHFSDDSKNIFSIKIAKIE